MALIHQAFLGNSRKADEIYQQSLPLLRQKNLILEQWAVYSNPN
jgi:hypothetical protein